MSETKPEVLPGDLISGPGVYMSRSNCPVAVRGYDSGYWKADWEDGARWYHSSGTQTGLPARNDPFQLVRWIGPLLEDIPTTSEQIAEIERQMTEPEPEPEDCGFEGKILREIPQPVQIREGRWRTRGGEVKYIKAGGSRRDNHYSWPWTDTLMCWQDNGFYHASKPSENDLVEYLGPSEPEPQPEGSCPQLHPWLRTPPEQQVDRIITPDDVAAEASAGVWDQAKAEQEIAELQAQVRFLKNRELTLGTRLEEEKAVTTKRLQQVEELRSEVSHVQGLLGESSRRVAELETLVKDLRNIHATAEKSVETAARENADLQHRLDTVAAEWAQQAEATRRLQIELDAREQVPQAVSDRFEEGWDKGTAQAVETIAEWTEVFRTCGSQGLSYHVMQNLPHIMRTLTGLTEED